MIWIGSAWGQTRKEREPFAKADRSIAASQCRRIAVAELQKTRRQMPDTLAEPLEHGLVPARLPVESIADANF